MSSKWANCPLSPWWKLSIYLNKVIKLPFFPLLWCEFCHVNKQLFQSGVCLGICPNLPTAETSKALKVALPCPNISRIFNITDIMLWAGYLLFYSFTVPYYTFEISKTQNLTLFLDCLNHCSAKSDCLVRTSSDFPQTGCRLSLPAASLALPNLFSSFEPWPLPLKVCWDSRIVNYH